MCCVPVYNLVYLSAFVSGNIFCASYVATYVVHAFNSWKYNAKKFLYKKPFYKGVYNERCMIRLGLLFANTALCAGIEHLIRN